MTAATLALRNQLLADPGGIVADVDLWFPAQQDPVGPEHAWNLGGPGPSRLRYVVWVDAGRWHGNGREGPLKSVASLPELSPRMALHVNHGRAVR
jgi:hypothetical protein